MEITICAEDLEKGWVMDLGDLKDVRKGIEAAWDHRVLINSDDPQLETLQQMHELDLINLHVMDVARGHGAALEGSCQYVMDLAAAIVQERTQGRAWVSKVEIWEKGDNRAALLADRPSGDQVFEVMGDIAGRIDRLLGQDYPDILRLSLQRFDGGQNSSLEVLSRGDGVNDALYRLSVGKRTLDHFLQLNAKRLVAVYYFPRGMVPDYFDYNLPGMRHAGYEVSVGESPERKGQQCVRCVANLPKGWITDPMEVSQWINDLVAMSRFMLLSVSERGPSGRLVPENEPFDSEAAA